MKTYREKQLTRQTKVRKTNMNRLKTQFKPQPLNTKWESCIDFVGLPKGTVFTLVEIDKKHGFACTYTDPKTGNLYRTEFHSNAFTDGRLKLLAKGQN